MYNSNRPLHADVLTSDHGIAYPPYNDAYWNWSEYDAIPVDMTPGEDWHEFRIDDDELDTVPDAMTVLVVTGVLALVMLALVMLAWREVAR